MTGWVTAQEIPVDKIVTEVGSALNGHRREFLAVLGDRSIHRIVVEHRDRVLPLGLGIRLGRTGCAGPGAAGGGLG